VISKIWSLTLNCFGVPLRELTFSEDAPIADGHGHGSPLATTLNRSFPALYCSMVHARLFVDSRRIGGAMMPTEFVKFEEDDL
jgi:hypothetical protein